MLTDIIKSVTKFSCERTDGPGKSVVVFAPRPFKDEPEVFLFVQKVGDKVEISDDAEVVLNHGNCEQAVDEIATIVRAAGLEFTNGAIKLSCDMRGLDLAIAKFLSVMAELAKREHDFSRMSAQAWRKQQALTAK